MLPGWVVLYGDVANGVQLQLPSTVMKLEAAMFRSHFTSISGEMEQLTWH